MLGWLERRDAALLRLFTTAAHAWQRATGKTSYWLARVAATAFAASQIIAVADYWFPELLHVRVGSWSLAAACVSVLVFLWLAIAMQEADEEFASDPSVLPEAAEICQGRVDTFLRVVGGVFFVPMTVGFIAHYLWLRHYIDALHHASGWPALVCALGFAAVTPLPPCAGKFSEWVKSLRASFGASVHESA
jgi:hypothetical protein